MQPLAPTHDSLWYYADASNEPVGPVPFAELQRLATAGAIHASTHVIESNGNEWKKFASLILPPPPVHVSSPAAHNQPSPPESQKNRETITAKGSEGTVTLSHEKIQITRNFFAAIGNEKLTEIPISAIRSIRWKTPGLLSRGFIQFVVDGAEQPERASFAMTHDRRAALFHQAELKSFHDLRREIERRHGIPISEEGAAENASGTNRIAASTGGCIGIAFGIIGLICGAMLCVTVVGALIGVPMIVGSLGFLGLSGRGIAWGAKPENFFEDDCPYCGHPKIKASVFSPPGLNCPACAKRIVIRDKKFLKVD